MGEHLLKSVYPQYDPQIIKRFCEMYQKPFYPILEEFTPNVHNGENCCICFTNDPTIPSYTTCCQNTFCQPCIERWLAESKQKRCPICRSSCFEALPRKSFEVYRIGQRRIIDLNYLQIRIRLERDNENHRSVDWHYDYCDPCTVHLDDDCKLDRYCLYCKTTLCSKQVDNHQECKNNLVSTMWGYYNHQRLLLNIMLDLEQYIKHLREHGPLDRLAEMESLFKEMKDFVNYQRAPEYIKKWPELRERLVEALKDWPDQIYDIYEPIILQCLVYLWNGHKRKASSHNS